MLLLPRLLVAVVLGAVAVSPLASAENDGSHAAAIVNVAFNKKLKKSILVDRRGRTLYVYLYDYRGRSACYDDPRFHCSQAWFPLRTTSAPHAGPGARASLLGVSRRTDGITQVTYNSRPLYTDEGPNKIGLIADKKAGDVNGQGFGGLWYVISPKGKPIEH